MYSLVLVICLFVSKMTNFVIAFYWWFQNDNQIWRSLGIKKGSLTHIDLPITNLHSLMSSFVGVVRDYMLQLFVKPSQRYYFLDLKHRLQTFHGKHRWTEMGVCRCWIRQKQKKKQLILNNPPNNVKHRGPVPPLLFTGKAHIQLLLFPSHRCIYKLTSVNQCESGWKCLLVVCRLPVTLLFIAMK